MIEFLEKILHVGELPLARKNAMNRRDSVREHLRIVHVHKRIVAPREHELEGILRKSRCFWKIDLTLVDEGDSLILIFEGCGYSPRRNREYIFIEIEFIHLAPPLLLHY